MESGLLSIEKSKSFMLAGNSTFTVVSKRTKNRYTFKIKSNDSNDSNDIFFVSYLNGIDNVGNYKFLGTIFKNNKNPFKYFPSRKNTKPNSIVNKSFEYVYNSIMSQNISNFEKIEFWHEGRCGRCGRKLTVPNSINSGLGPHCIKNS